MISEVLNSLLMTYIASEYLIFESTAASSGNDNNHRRGGGGGGGLGSFLQSRGRYLTIVTIPMIIINLLDHYHFSSLNDLPLVGSLRRFVYGIFHLPKIVFAMWTYLIGLYLDIRRLVPLLTIRQFAGKVGWAFLRHAPAYPLLAVLISFGFLFVITIWDILGLPEEWLNVPIYYGTLYGPLAFIYVTTKRQIVYEITSLPVYH